LLVIAKQTQAFGNIAHPPQTLRSNRTDIRFKFTPILLNFDICLSHGGLIPCIFIFAFSLRLALKPSKAYWLKAPLEQVSEVRFGSDPDYWQAKQSGVTTL
jgi:hypothetical protein